jgi:quercetin dioxygenase-like cupin family protein
MSDVFCPIDELAPQRIWEGVTVRARHGKELTLAVVELDPGSVIPEHSHANEQAGILVEGAVTFRVGAETHDLVRGASWCIPANAPHEVRVNAERAVIIESFAPPRDDWQAQGWRTSSATILPPAS